MSSLLLSSVSHTPGRETSGARTAVSWTRTPARDVRALRWCRERGHDALPARDMADHLATLCNKAGLSIDTVDGKPLIVGVKLLSQSYVVG